MHKAFFGDRERDFALTSQMIPELQKLTGKGIAAIIEGFRRASYAEITETIRLGLIGGGTSPQEAAELVAIYIPARPLAEAHMLAYEILHVLWIGSEEQPVNDAAAINAGASHE